MKKILIALVLVFAAGTARAEEGKSMKAWYNDLLRGLKTKISKGIQSKNSVAAVAAVRGAKQGTDATALYWKGGVSDKAQQKLADEQQKLAAAVQLVVDGDNAGGRAALTKFLRENPESFFAQEAKDALARLPAEEAKPAESKPEAKPGDKEEAKPEPKGGN